MEVPAAKRAQTLATGTKPIDSKKSKVTSETPTNATAELWLYRQDIKLQIRGALEEGKLDQATTWKQLKEKHDL